MTEPQHLPIRDDQWQTMLTDIDAVDEQLRLDEAYLRVRILARKALDHTPGAKALIFDPDLAIYDWMQEPPGKTKLSAFLSRYPETGNETTIVGVLTAEHTVITIPGVTGESLAGLPWWDTYLTGIEETLPELSYTRVLELLNLPAWLNLTDHELANDRIETGMNTHLTHRVTALERMGVFLPLDTRIITEYESATKVVSPLLLLPNDATIEQLEIELGNTREQHQRTTIETSRRLHKLGISLTHARYPDAETLVLGYTTSRTGNRHVVAYQNVHDEWRLFGEFVEDLDGTVVGGDGDTFDTDLARRLYDIVDHLFDEDTTFETVHGFLTEAGESLDVFRAFSLNTHRVDELADRAVNKLTGDCA